MTEIIKSNTRASEITDDVDKHMEQNKMIF